MNEILYSCVTQKLVTGNLEITHAYVATSNDGNRLDFRKHRLYSRVRDRI